MTKTILALGLLLIAPRQGCSASGLIFAQGRVIQVSQQQTSVCRDHVVFEGDDGRIWTISIYGCRHPLPVWAGLHCIIKYDVPDSDGDSRFLMVEKRLKD